MIEEFCSSISEATLITRSGRFGKTINMSMMAEFFNITKDSGKLFESTYLEYGRYEIVSNREMGDGRVDLMMKSRDNHTDIIFELKKAESADIDLKKLAVKAVNQIKEKRYAQKEDTLMIGIAHYLKNCEIEWETK